MKNKLTSLQQIYYRCIEQDIKVCACIISSAIINETLCVMYHMVKKTQLFASVGKCIGAPHLSLQALNTPHDKAASPGKVAAEDHYPRIINRVRTPRS